MKNNNILDNILKTTKKNYKTILVILLLLIVIILLFVFRPSNIENFTNDIPKNTNTAPNSNTVTPPILFGRYIDYTVISPSINLIKSNDNITSITYKLSSISQIESIGFNNNNGDNLGLSSDLIINLSIIKPNESSTEYIGDIGIDGTGDVNKEDFTIKKDAITTNSYTNIIRKARTVLNNSPVVTDTLKITVSSSSNTKQLPLKFLNSICFFGKATDDSTEKTLYYDYINSTDDTIKIKNFTNNNITSTTIDNKKVFEIDYKKGSDGVDTQISARYIKLSSTTQLYKNTPTPTLTGTTIPNTITIPTEPSYISANITYRNNLLNNANLTLPYSYKLIPVKIGTTYEYYIFFPVPLIMNSIVISYDIPSITNNFTNVSIIGRYATSADIDDYSNYVDNNVNNNTSGILTSKESMTTLDVCPSDISEIIKVQKTTQDICDNIEYQDKIKAEKAKLEREKVYLIKLKSQYDEIKGLQNTINALEARKQQRNENADAMRLLQYQKQKAQAAELRSVALDKATQYDKNQLYFDVNLQKTA